MSFMRSLFGPSTEEIWRQLCAEIGAQYVEGGFWKGNKVRATHGPWTITLDTYTVSDGKTSVAYTRMRAPFVDPEGFRFTVYRRGVFSDIGKWLGMQDIEIGDEAFDEDFILKSNEETKLRELLGSTKIRELISQQPDIYFSIKDDEGAFVSNFPGGVDELCRIGSANESAPGVSL